ncbi:protein abrupt isoform X2 [Cephus cinctus]|uniref:Protein abrupt isoform X2 n=1 Tax=Cephus cinctus TaxID=211228 RepID=A0AAJ7C6Z2_CEPCN|nr:protein abrupt isoform X2 [Cephus cinctus]
MAANTVGELHTLKWNNFLNSLTDGFVSHLAGNDLVDVTLLVDGKILQAHKLVLSICSPYFKTVFKTNPCQHPVIILKDMSFAHVNVLVNFMYQGEVDIKVDDLPDILRAAQNLQITGLCEHGDFNNTDENSSNQDLDESNATCLVINDAHSKIGATESKTKLRNGQQITASLEDIGMCLDRDKTSMPSDENVIKPNDSKSSNTSYKRLINLEVEMSMKRGRRSPPPLIGIDDPQTPSLNSVLEVLQDQQGNFTPISIEDSIKNENVTYNEEADSKRTVQTNNSGLPSCSKFIPLQSEQLTRQVVEPVIYRLSARGRPQLVHEGYVYNLTSRSEHLNRSHYRCAEQHRGCRGKCAVIAERFMPTGVNEHNHPPGYQSEHDYRKKKGLDTDTM